MRPRLFHQGLDNKSVATLTEQKLPLDRTSKDWLKFLITLDRRGCVSIRTASIDPASVRIRVEDGWLIVQMMSHRHGKKSSKWPSAIISLSTQYKSCAKE